MNLECVCLGGMCVSNWTPVLLTPHQNLRFESLAIAWNQTESFSTINHRSCFATHRARRLQVYSVWCPRRLLTEIHFDNGIQVYRQTLVRQRQLEIVEWIFQTKLVGNDDLSLSGLVDKTTAHLEQFGFLLFPNRTFQAGEFKHAVPCIL